MKSISFKFRGKSESESTYDGVVSGTDNKKRNEPIKSSTLPANFSDRTKDYLLLDSTPKLRKNLMSGKVVVSISPKTTRKGISTYASPPLSPVVSQHRTRDSMARRKIQKDRNAVEGTSFSTILTDTSEDLGNSSSTISSSRKGSIDDSVNSLSLESSSKAKTLPASLSSDQLKLSFNEKQSRSEKKKSAATSEIPKGRRSHFKNIFRTKKKSSKKNPKHETEEEIKPNSRPRSQSLSSGDETTTTEMLQRYIEENEALKSEILAKEQELEIMNATIDQANQSYQSKITNLKQDVENANNKAIKLQKLIIEGNDMESKVKPSRRVPMEKARRTSSSSIVGGLKSPTSPIAKRKGIRAPKQAMTPVSTEKTDEIREKLFQALCFSKCMSQLSKENLDKVVDVMKCKKIITGERLMHEGNTARAFFVLADGECIIYKQKSDQFSPNLSHNGRKVKMWEIFGEDDVLYHTRRVLSCRCTSQGLVWFVTAEMLRAIVSTKDIRRNEVSQFLKNISDFKNLEDSHFRMLANVSRVEQYCEHDYIVKQDSYCNSVYIIKEGSVTITKELDGTETIQGTLNPGDIYDATRLTNYSTNSGIACNKEVVQCIVIPRAYFDLVRKFLLTSDESVTLSLAKMKLRPDDQGSQRTGSSSGYGSDIGTPGSNRKTVPKRFGYEHQEAFEEKTKLLKQSDKSDFYYIQTIGKGAFGSVDLVSLKGDERNLFAVKKLSKHEIVKTEQQKNVISERSIQMDTSQYCPFIVSLYSTFKDDRYVYLVMEFCPGGELFSLLKASNSFNDNSGRFYTGCIVEALTYLHSKNIIFRDLKPENVVIDRRGFCKLTDFGFTKEVSPKSFLRTYTYCGTPEYMAPEIILHQAQTFAVDLWALGVFVYELLVGKSPFRNKDRQVLADTILGGIQPILQVATENNRISDSAASLVRDLCQIRPEDRFGSSKRGISEVKSHSWFHKFDWNSLRLRKMIPPWVPNLKSPTDLQYFNTRFKSSDNGNHKVEFSNWDEEF